MRTNLKVPYAEKDEARKRGARWDATRKTWYVENIKNKRPSPGEIACAYREAGQEERTMKRPPFQTRTFRLVGTDQRARLIALVENLPLDAAKPLEVVIREEKKARKLDQNALYWAGPLRDIAEQAWVAGRQYNAEVWHEHFKREFLPDPDRADCDDSHIKDGYVKWSAMPNGSRVLIGSTTGLTVRGMAAYLEQVYAYGASLGVQFSERSNG